jgi:murein L,D-transpeptidase YafK
MRAIKLLALIFVVCGVAGCGSKFKTYNGPEVTRVIVSKEERRLFLMHHDKVLRNYPVELGRTPEGHKQFQGDGKTPEGHYYIDRQNPNSAFHLSIGISYPNHVDRAFARERGKNPGGDIFIHGRPNGDPRKNDDDWTEGCIALKNRHMEWVYAMVRTRTPITILP